MPYISMLIAAIRSNNGCDMEKKLMAQFYPKCKQLRLQCLFMKECLKEGGLTKLETQRLVGDQVEMFQILPGYENIDSNIL